jgi:hypothetical protein
LRELELNQRLTGNRDLLTLLGSCDSRSSAGAGERTNPGTLSSSCDPADERTESSAADY